MLIEKLIVSCHAHWKCSPLQEKAMSYIWEEVAVAVEQGAELDRDLG